MSICADFGVDRGADQYPPIPLSYPATRFFLFFFVLSCVRAPPFLFPLLSLVLFHVSETKKNNNKWWKRKIEALYSRCYQIDYQTLQKGWRLRFFILRYFISQVSAQQLLFIISYFLKYKSVVRFLFPPVSSWNKYPILVVALLKKKTQAGEHWGAVS